MRLSFRCDLACRSGYLARQCFPEHRRQIAPAVREAIGTPKPVARLNALTGAGHLFVRLRYVRIFQFFR